MHLFLADLLRSVYFMMIDLDLCKVDRFVKLDFQGSYKVSRFTWAFCSLIRLYL